MVAYGFDFKDFRATARAKARKQSGHQLDWCFLGFGLVLEVLQELGSFKLI